MSSRPSGPAASRFVAAVALALVAVNARPALSSLGPVLPEALAATGLSRTEAGLLTTLPVLLLGLFGLMGPAVSRKFGAERAVLILTLVLAGGVALRLLGTAPALIVSCAIGGAMIGTVNVILPAVVKRDFPDRTAMMMGVYTMALVGGAAIGAGATVPLSHALGGWQRGLAFWSAPALLAAALWAWKGPKGGPAAAEGLPPMKSLWRNPLAWQVTLFMGLQSSLAYALFAWAPAMLRDRGFDPVEAGLIFSVSILFQIPAGLTAPALAMKGKDQRLAVVVGMGLSSIGIAGLLFAPLSQALVWSAITGLGQGAVFAVALTIVILRSGDGREAAAMSAMSQGVGYSLAAVAPLLAGLFRDLTGNWTLSILSILGIGVVATLFGLGAGRNRRLSEFSR